ncbi:MAG: F0F1 ATP synthase subunit delta [Micrococcales bacterium]|nr:F0F1 ATP synthase subunit delta [Micrococcales bacterium]
MASSTRQALAQAKSEISGYLASGLSFAKDLFTIADAIAGNAQLRGMLSDPSTESSAKSSLIERVFAGKVSKEAVEFLKTFSGKRFSRGIDLVVGLEQLGVHAAAASSSSELDDVLAELFAFSQIVSSDRELQFALSSKSAPSQAKLALVETLVGNKVKPATKALIVQAVAGARGRKVGTVLDQFTKQVAAFGESLVANVTVAAAITADQEKQLVNNLAKTYGQAIKLNVSVNPAIIGGIVVEIAGEIIDGSVASRLTNLKQQLVKTAASANRS